MPNCAAQVRSYVMRSTERLLERVVRFVNTALRRGCVASMLVCVYRAIWCVNIGLRKCCGVKTLACVRAVRTQCVEAVLHNLIVDSAVAASERT